VQADLSIDAGIEVMRHNQTCVSALTDVGSAPIPDILWVLPLELSVPSARADNRTAVIEGLPLNPIHR
jgi:hypothetical protein